MSFTAKLKLASSRPVSIALHIISSPSILKKKAKITIYPLMKGSIIYNFRLMIDIAAKKGTKYTKIMIYILEYQIVMGVKNTNLDFFTRPSIANRQ
jgi:hypothetical protein